jgi:tetratricopeptide (TPR) repeat protein
LFARALFNKGITLGALGRSEDAIAAYDDVVGRFGLATEAPLREQVAMALVNKGVTLGALGRSEDAIAAYDDVVDRFGLATEAPLREQVAMAQQLRKELSKATKNRTQPRIKTVKATRRRPSDGPA